MRTSVCQELRAVGTISLAIFFTGVYYPFTATAQQLSGVFDLANADAVFTGLGPNDLAGGAVSSAGDVNGDGLADLLLGAPRTSQGGVEDAGETYLVYGQPAGSELTETISLATADATFQGLPAEGFAGFAVSSAGDVDGDGYSDLLIGAYLLNENRGETYLVYGKDAGDPLAGDISLAAADAIFQGIDDRDRAGYAVSTAGDVNGDGLDDFLIGAGWADPNGIFGAGETYLIYGSDSNNRLAGTINLSTADVIFNGMESKDLSGWSVSTAGDVNGDGFDDLLIGAYNTLRGLDNQIGETYLVYGRGDANPLPATFELSAADATFRGIDGNDFSGFSVASAGDVNGDGLSDLLISAVLAAPSGEFQTGEAYLVYGRDGVDEHTGLISLATADAVFMGIDTGDQAGYSVSSAGDVNGDGLDDLLIGARNADPSGISRAGEVYLMYGRAGPSELMGSIDLSLADVVFTGINADDRAGFSVSSAGDVNGDGLADLLIGAPHPDDELSPQAGKAYLIYGRAVPEPGTVVLLVMGCFAGLMRRRRRCCR